MGKKSKGSKAKAKEGAGGGSTGLGGSGGSTAGAARGAAATSKKAQKCVQCWATVKSDKGISCPGCSQLYCWRCEKKAFEACPNGSKCVHPLRRCISCVSGATLTRVVKDADGLHLDHHARMPEEEARKHHLRFRQLIDLNDSLTVDSIPVIQCFRCGDTYECAPCADGPETKLIMSCRNRDRCFTDICFPCYHRMLGEIKTNEEIMELCASHRGEQFGAPPSAAMVHRFGKVLRNQAAEWIVICPKCKLGRLCIGCMDDRFLRSVIGTMNGHGELTCPSCYWSAKPCTNPSCPNEIGVPTKRCGDCHIDRYCSVQCQAAAYPDHVGRCKKILAKRAAGVAVAAEKD